MFRDLSDRRLVPLAAFLAKQQGLHLSAVTDRQRDVFLDVAESALRHLDQMWIDRYGNANGSGKD